jgi:hypothetical protein
MDGRQQLMTSFMQNLPMLQSRLLHVLDVSKSVNEMVLESLRWDFASVVSGLSTSHGWVLTWAGGASSHGVLSPPGNTAGNKIKPKVIVFHGWEDPFAPPDNLVALAQEVSAAEADWQIHAYGIGS